LNSAKIVFYDKEIDSEDPTCKIHVSASDGCDDDALCLEVVDMIISTLAIKFEEEEGVREFGDDIIEPGHESFFIEVTEVGEDSLSFIYGPTQGDITYQPLKTVAYHTYMYGVDILNKICDAQEGSEECLMH